MAKPVCVAFLGPESSGKSTLMGHLLIKAGSIDKRTQDRVDRDSAGNPGQRFAMLLDGRQGARDFKYQAMTVDLKPMQLKNYVLVDCPGKDKFMGHTVVAANMADVSVVVVDVSRVDVNAYTKAAAAPGDSASTYTEAMRDALVLASYFSPVRHIVFALTCMDIRYDNVPGAGGGGGGAEPDREEAGAAGKKCFEDVTAALTRMMAKAGIKAGASDRGFTWSMVPVSGYRGDNLVKACPDQMPWYVGLPLMAAIDEAAAKAAHPMPTDSSTSQALSWSARDMPLRMPVLDAFKVGGIGTVVSGRVASGVLKPGDSVCFAPHGVVTQVRSVEVWREPCADAGAATMAALAVRGFRTRAFKRGMVICSPGDAPLLPAAGFTAKLTILSTGKDGRVWRLWREGYCPSVVVGAARVACRVEKLEVLSTGPGKGDIPLPRKKGTPAHGHLAVRAAAPVNSLGAPRGPLVPLRDGAALRVRLVPCGPLVVERYEDAPALGAVVIMENNRLMAVGKVEAVEHMAGYPPKDMYRRAARKADPSKWELPAAELPAAELLAAELPAAELPAAELLAAELPAAELPAAELLAAELPAAELPAADEGALPAPTPAVEEQEQAQEAPAPHAQEQGQGTAAGDLAEGGAAL